MLIFQFIDDGGFPIFPEEAKEAAPVTNNVNNTSSNEPNTAKPANGRVS